MRHVLIAAVALVCAVAANAQFATSDLLVAKEGCFTQLSASIDSSVTSIPVTAGTGTRCAVNQVVIVESEKMLVTAAAANALTVTRGYASTTAATHASGLYVSSNVFVEYHNRLVTALQALVGTDNLVDPARLAPSPDGTKCLKGDKTWGACGTGGGTGLTLPAVTGTFPGATVTVGTGAAGVGAATYTYASSVPAQITAQSAADTVRFYVDTSGNRRAQYDGAKITGITLAAGLTADTTGTAFPLGSHPLASCAASGGNFTSCTDERAVRSYAFSGAGGISVTPSGNTLVIDGSGITGGTGCTWTAGSKATWTPLPFGGEEAVLTTGANAVYYVLVTPSCSGPVKEIYMEGFSSKVGNVSVGVYSYNGTTGTLLGQANTILTGTGATNRWVFSSAVSVAAGTPYLIGVSGDAAISMWGVGWGSGKPTWTLNPDTMRTIFTGATASTGTTTITMPATTGTLTGDAKGIPSLLVRF